MSNFFAMAAFSLAMSISPGPVNVITLAIGANGGIRKALPFVAGATIGFTLLLFLIGIGLGELAQRLPNLFNILNIISTVFICYLGYTIAISTGLSHADTEKLPDFKQGFLLQWLNPKAWAACLAGAALFNTSESTYLLFSFVTIYCVVCFFGIGSWAVLGQRAYIYINSPIKMQWFNRTLGGVLIVVALFMFAQHLSGK